MEEFYEKALIAKTNEEETAREFDKKSESHFEETLNNLGYIKGNHFYKEPDFSKINQKITKKIDFVFGGIEHPTHMFEIKNLSITREDLLKFKKMTKIDPGTRIRKVISKAVTVETEKHKRGNFDDYKSIDCVKVVVVYDYLHLNGGVYEDLMMEAVYGKKVLTGYINTNKNKIINFYRISKNDRYIEEGMFLPGINEEISGYIYVTNKLDAKIIEQAKEEDFVFYWVENIYARNKFSPESIFKDLKIQNVEIYYGNDTVWLQDGNLK